MKIVPFGHLCLLVLLCSNSALSQEAQQYSVEVRYLSTHEAIIRSLELPTFATSAVDENLNGFGAKDQTLLADDGAGIRLAVSKTAVESRLPVSIEVLTETQARQLLEGIVDDRGSSLIQAPKLLVLAGQTAQIADQVQRPFVTGFEPGTGVDNILTLKPIVHVATDGTSALLRVRPLTETSQQLDLRLVQSSIKQVRESSTGNGSSLVQVPEIAKNELELSARVESGRYLFVWWPSFEQPRAEKGVIARASAIFANSDDKQNSVVGLMVYIAKSQK